LIWHKFAARCFPYYRNHLKNKLKPIEWRSGMVCAVVTEK